MENNNDDDVVSWTPAMMLEITLAEPDDFLKVKETLTRIGIASSKDSTLYQSCHILHKQGRYFIVHFKELFLLDGNKANLQVSDIKRRNTIATLLMDWGLLDMPKSRYEALETTSLKSIKIISFKDKANWTLSPKYSIGNTSRPV